MASKPRPNTAPKKLLPNAEIQALAEAAFRAWETGLDVEVEDTLGGAWLFRVVRDERAGLSLLRCTGIDEDDEERVQRRDGFVGGQEFGAHENIMTLLASRILALSGAP